MIRLLKTLTVALVGVVLLGAVAYGILVAVNRFDEPLSNEARAFIAAADLKVPPEQNGYFAMLGWRAGAGRDAHRSGRDAFERWRSASREERAFLHIPQDIPMPPEDNLCRRQLLDCLAQVSLDLQRYQRAVAQHPALLRRLASLQSYPRFHGPPVMGQHPDEPVLLPPYHELLKLGATESAVLWLSGRHAQALKAIAARAEVARRAMRDASSALELVLAEVWLRSEIGLVSEVMAAYPTASARHARTIASILRPLTAEELHSGQWLRGEYAIASGMIFAVPESETARTWLIGEMLHPGLFTEMLIDKKPVPVLVKLGLPLLAPLFQPGATSNLLYEEFSHAVVKQARASTLEIAKGRQRAGSVQAPSAFLLRNPVGRWYMASEERARPWVYMAERHDLDRFVLLCRVQLELIERRLTPEQVGAFLASSPAATDPATALPVNWDATASRLWVSALTDRWGNGTHPAGAMRGQISVTYRRPGAS